MELLACRTIHSSLAEEDALSTFFEFFFVSLISIGHENTCFLSSPISASEIGFSDAKAYSFRAATQH